MMKTKNDIITSENKEINNNTKPDYTPPQLTDLSKVHDTAGKIASGMEEGSPIGPS